MYVCMYVYIKCYLKLYLYNEKFFILYPVSDCYDQKIFECKGNKVMPSYMFAFIRNLIIMTYILPV